MITTRTIQGIELHSLNSVLFQNWAVKASITADGIICLVLFNTLTYDVCIKYFEDEEQAHDYVHYKLN